MFIVGIFKKIINKQGYGERKKLIQNVTTERWAWLTFLFASIFQKVCVYVYVCVYVFTFCCMFSPQFFMNIFYVTQQILISK